MPGKQSKTQKKNARRRAKARATTSGRMLMRGQLPRPYLRIKEGEIDTVTVSGLEVVAGLNTSQTVRTNAVGINPARADIFPRLSAFALQYERFRFNGCAYTTTQRARLQGLVLWASQFTRSIPLPRK